MDYNNGGESVYFCPTYSIQWGWTQPVGTKSCRWAGWCAHGTPISRACFCVRCRFLLCAARCLNYAASGSLHNQFWDKGRERVRFKHIFQRGHFLFKVMEKWLCFKADMHAFTKQLCQESLHCCFPYFSSCIHANYSEHKIFTRKYRQRREMGANWMTLSV